MEIRKERDVVIIQLEADDLSDPKRMSDVLENLLCVEGERKIVADLSRIDAIYSIQIGTLVTLHVMCYENVAVMKLAGATEKVKNLLRMVGLETLMEFHHGAEVAAQSFGRTLPPGSKSKPGSPADPRVR